MLAMGLSKSRNADTTKNLYTFSKQTSRIVYARATIAVGSELIRKTNTKEFGNIRHN